MENKIVKTVKTTTQAGMRPHRSGNRGVRRVTAQKTVTITTTKTIVKQVPVTPEEKK